MTSTPLKVLEFDSSDPLSMGHQHGEIFRDQIKEIAEIRMERMCTLSEFKNIKDVLALAERHIEVVENFDVDVFLELRGISEASNVSLEEIIVINHYTDMRDIKKDYRAYQNHNNDDLGGCSIIFNGLGENPVLGQTWDIHGSALPYVVLLKTKDALVFSITGCLGMTGLNDRGVSVAINNLNSTDAKVGIIWPGLVRKCLSHDSAKLAKDETMQAPLGSGHHYAIADEKNFYSIETSGTKKKIIEENVSKNYFHTNHCLDDEMRKTHIIRPESNTLWRYEHLQNEMANKPLKNAQEIFLALEGVSLDYDKNLPHKPATCGTFVMDIKNRFVLACKGAPNRDLLECPQVKVSL